MGFKQILKGIKILFSSIFRVKSKYIISFTKEDDGKWYVDFPNWPFDHHNLMMVAGADKLCEALSYDGRHTKVEVVIANRAITRTEFLMDMDVVAERMEHSIAGGSNYYANAPCLRNNLFWLCPVTLFVLGKYPKYLYIKKLESALCGLFLYTTSITSYISALLSSELLAEGVLLSREDWRVHPTQRICSR